METPDVRAAAEEMLVGGGDSPPWKRCQSVARAWLAEHPADDAEPVTREWCLARRARKTNGLEYGPLLCPFCGCAFEIRVENGEVIFDVMMQPAIVAALEDANKDGFFDGTLTSLRRRIEHADAILRCIGREK